MSEHEELKFGWFCQRLETENMLGSPRNGTESGLFDTGSTNGRNGRI